MIPTMTPTKDVTVRVFEVRFKDAGQPIQTVLSEQDSIDFQDTKIVIQSDKGDRTVIYMDHVAAYWMKAPQTVKQYDTFVPSATVVSDGPDTVM